MESMTKFAQIVRSLVVVVVAVCASACTSVPRTPNQAYFNVGDVVGADKEYQFLAITTEEAWHIEVEYTTPEGESDWCQFSATEGKGNTTITMTFGANPLTVERALTITIHFTSEDIVLPFTQRATSNTTDNEDLSGWLELPAFEADGTRTYFSKHMLSSKGNRERSFSLLYDSDIYHSHWVAYPLCSGNMNGSGNRQDDWGIFDPNIPTEKQLYMKNSYYGNYDRGHLLPSASRLGSNEDNYKTFYPTNMSPQLSGLNQQKWAGIENQVRDWAEGCDTLYVVTGSVFRTVGGNETISYTNCRSDNSKDVAIPNYYYKALLQYRKSSNTYQALAIWVPHKAATGGATLNDVITIDKLEERTGMDFFPNLQDAVENAVEGKVENIYWGF